MKRNWKIIRAVLREEGTDQWEESILNEHRWLCVDAGYVNAHAVVTMGREMQVVRIGLPWLTTKGQEAAELLKYEYRLDNVLRELDDKRVGHVSDVVFAMLGRPCFVAERGGEP